MKFLFFSGQAHLALDPSSSRASGGAELQVALLAEELVARGHHVTLVVSDKSQEDRALLRGIRVRVAQNFHCGTLWRTFLAIPAVMAILAEEKPQFVAIYGWTAWLYLFAKWRKFFSYSLLFICALDSEIERTVVYTNRWREWLFQRGMYLCDHRFAITEHQQKLFHQRGMSCSLTRLLLQKNDASSFLKKEGDKQKKTIDLLWVARCHWIKQPLLFLELAERFPKARCQMICSHQDQKLWERLQSELPKVRNIEFLGAAPYQHIQTYFNHAKIFVNTSLEEGVPNTFIHAGLGHCALVSLCVDPDGMFSRFGVGGCAQNKKEYFFQLIDQLLREEHRLLLAQEEAARFIRTWHQNEENVNSFLQGLEGLIKLN